MTYYNTPYGDLMLGITTHKIRIKEEEQLGLRGGLEQKPVKQSWAKRMKAKLLRKKDELEAETKDTKLIRFLSITRIENV